MKALTKKPSPDRRIEKLLPSELDFLGGILSALIESAVKGISAVDGIRALGDKNQESGFSVWKSS